MSTYQDGLAVVSAALAANPSDPHVARAIHLLRGESADTITEQRERLERLYGNLKRLEKECASLEKRVSEAVKTLVWYANEGNCDTNEKAQETLRKLGYGRDGKPCLALL